MLYVATVNVSGNSDSGTAEYSTTCVSCSGLWTRLDAQR